MRKLLDLAVDDDAVAVRARAASALGRFILLGEFEEIPAEQANAAVDTAISIYNDVDEDVEVRRRALEALGHSSHTGVDDLIREAYESHEQLMKVSAVFAMGKSADPKWASIVTREMNSGDAELRFEAARAAGELGLEEAVPKLSRLAYEPDREVKESAIWALGEIGGHEAQRVLNALIQDPAVVEDEDLQEALDDALAAATLPGSLTLFEIDEETGEEVEIEFDYSDDDDYALWDDEDDDRSRLN
jgi:HEAT repeat protein